MDFLETCKLIEDAAKNYGISEIEELNGDMVPVYKINMMSLVKNFPDTEIWKLEVLPYSKYIYVEFNDRVFECQIDEQQYCYLVKRYGLKQEEGSVE